MARHFGKAKVMAVPIYVVDAFANQPFRGNPAAVVILDEDRPAEWMQQVAAEMKHAETAFVRQVDKDWYLRWFTPTTEVDLCGHATLATAHVLFSRDFEGPFQFHTKSGVLTAHAHGDEIVLDFPAEEPYKADPPADMVAILGQDPIWFGRNRMDWFAQLADDYDLTEMKIDFAQVEALGLRGLIVTASSTMFDFVSRFFAPQAGVPEDPVTGSAHCALAPFWATRLGKQHMRGLQVSQRQGVVGVHVRGNRVELSGRAITVLQGSLLV